MLGIGATELFVVAALALMLFSPRELPNILRSVMKFWGSIKRTADDFKDAIMQEEAMQELRDAYKGTKDVVRRAETDARRELMKARSEVRKAQGKLARATQFRDQAPSPTSGAKPVPATVASAASEPKRAEADPSAAADAARETREDTGEAPTEPSPPKPSPSKPAAKSGDSASQGAA